MPLADYSLKVIRDVLVDADRDPVRTGRVLCLACPDVIASRKTLVGIFGSKVKDVPARADGDEIVNWHKAWDVTDEVLDTRALFAALGYQMDAVDITEGRGGEIIHDLSEPLPREFDEKYDLVFDCISNQVFSVAACWVSMTSACRIGGTIVSVTPQARVNQGFWSVSPTAYHDFSASNGLLLTYRAIKGINEYEKDLPVNPTARFDDVPRDAMNLAVMHKTKSTPARKWPIMTKFKNNPKAQLPGKRS